MEIQFDREVRLGQGGYGAVFPGTFRGKKVAVKRVQLIDATNENEENILQKLNHPNIVRLFHFCSDDNFKYFALELCAASLDQIFLGTYHPRKYDGPELPNYSTVFLQLAEGLEYIHSEKLIHRDIKPGNVLIYVDSTDGKITMKWADFGLSRSVNERGTYAMSSGIKGTRNWYAPELLKLMTQFQQSTQRRGTVKSDVYALGLVFAYLLLDGQHLYGSNELEINNNIVAHKQVNINRIDRSNYALELISKMLNYEHVDRISSGEVVIQLKSIKQKEEEERIQEIQLLIQVGIDVNVKNEREVGYDYKAFPGTFKGRAVAFKRVAILDAKNNKEDALKKLNHPNIVKLIHVETVVNFKYYVLELCDASLDQIFLETNDPRKYNGPELPHHFTIFLQLAEGLEYIHSKNLIHRDIKPENVLIYVDSTGKITMKLADFGLSKLVNERGTYAMNSKVKEANKWLAPELLQKLMGNEETLGQGTVKSDVFALGLALAYLLLKGHHLYGSNEIEIINNIVANEQVNISKIDQSHYALELFNKMFEFEQNDRITSGDVVIQLKRIKQKREKELRHLCVEESLDFEKLKKLIQFGIDVNGKDNDGWNALHYLCRNNSSEKLIDAIKLLIQLGIDVNGKNNFGWNALDILCQFNSSEKIIDAIELLIQSGIDITFLDGVMVKIFLRRNSNLNQKKELVDDIIKLIDRAVAERAIADRAQSV